MQETVYNIRNRRVGASDIQTIRQFIETRSDRGRTVISKLLCEHWNWRQPNGFLKDRACRDTFIGWDAETRKQRLHMVVNNVGFLILPWIRVKDMASRLLAENIRVLADDWYQFYAYPVVLAETFVDGRFASICYKASNWMQACDTKGRGKYDRYNQCSGSVKAVFLYPLQKNSREVLRW